ncbi:MAG: hypothetical protein FWD31_11545 [Planctomycetaceae bacterium]|nr:hypothetical protein [Planctomycetaceae bacterium]
MNKALQKISCFVAVVICGVILLLAASGVRDITIRYVSTPVTVQTSDSVSFITGPVAADIGELCVFRLNDVTKRADWCVVRQSDVGPPPICYIDSSGSSIAFASNISAKYTIVAAIVENGVSKILMHICEYGFSPTPPNPGPIPNPGPGPQPEPEPTTLAAWVRQNIPVAGRPQQVILASCYEAVADAIDAGTIKSQAAAFASIRTNTQAKIKPGTWEPFLEKLSEQIQSKLDGNADVKRLCILFREVADGLKEPVHDVFDNGDFVCPDPTGQACRVPINKRSR